MKKPSLIETLLWDWNGTLIDDLELSIRSMNHLLEQRLLPLLSEQRYREIFTFPVKDYYNELGFDFERENFEIPAEAFILEYTKGLARAALFEDAADTLSYFQQSGFSQHILSAMEQNALEASIQARGIAPLLNSINGIQDHLAHGKLHMARQLIRTQRIDPDSSLLIGDTLHDYEVARELGIDCILVARGHQSYQRLKTSGSLVLGSLAEVKEIFKKNL